MSPDAPPVPAASEQRLRTQPDAAQSVLCDTDLPMSLGVLRRGPGDPTYRVTADGAIWRACLTPDGPGTVRVRRDGPLVGLHAWGAGAAWLVKQAEGMLGLHDALGDFPALVAGH